MDKYFLCYLKSKHLCICPKTR